MQRLWNGKEFLNKEVWMNKGSVACIWYIEFGEMDRDQMMQNQIDRGKKFEFCSKNNRKPLKGMYYLTYIFKNSPWLLCRE